MGGWLASIIGSYEWVGETLVAFLWCFVFVLSLGDSFRLGVSWVSCFSFFIFFISFFHFYSLLFYLFDHFIALFILLYAFRFALAFNYWFAG